MFTPRNPTAAEKRMINDALLVAAHVCKDMGRAFCNQDTFWSDYLADKYGPVSYADLSYRKAAGAYFLQDDAIVLDTLIPSERAKKTLRHEITHRFCIGTERYADLNQPRFAEYDWLTFQEIIAELVGMAFVSKRLYNILMRLLECC